MKKLIINIITFFLISEFNVSAQQIPIDSAAYYLKTYKAVCELDNGKLWGVNLYTNQLIFDKENRYVISNFKDTLGILKPDNGLFIGHLPDTIKPKQLGFCSWVHVWPTVNIGRCEDVGVFVHESFHYFQDSLKIKPKAYNNKHINEMNARIGIRMECYFLMKAVMDSINALNYINEAIKCRRWRQNQYPQSMDNERKLEILEGLAQYTGNYLACKYFNIDMSIPAQRIYYSVLEKNDTIISSSFERSFGYVSGQFYAILLDRYYPEWRKALTKNSDLAIMLKNKLNIKSEENLFNPFTDYKDSLKFQEVIKSEHKRKEKKSLTNI